MIEEMIAIASILECIIKYFSQHWIDPTLLAPHYKLILKIDSK